MFRKTILALLSSASLAAPAAAQSTLGTPVEAPKSLFERVQAANTPFEKASYQTLSAVEGLMQGFYEYRIGWGTAMFFRGRNRGWTNPQPTPRQPDSFRNIVLTFLEDLDSSRETLANVTPDTAQPFVLDAKSLWFDLNKNGSLDRGEEGVNYVTSLLGRRAARDIPEGPIEIRFDRADHAWLTAYTHVLSAQAEAVLAFDPTPVFKDLQDSVAALSEVPTIKNAYDPEVVNAEIEKFTAQKEELKVEIDARRAKQKELRDQVSDLRKQQKTTADETLKAELAQQIKALREQQRSPEVSPATLSRESRLIDRQIRAAKAKLNNDNRGLNIDTAEVRDVHNGLYALLKSLEQEPDKTRVAAVEQHFRAMLKHNRIFWAEVAKETDNDREWVPNSEQMNAFGLEVSATTADIWQSILQDAEDVLDGKLLIQHPLLPKEYGINLAAWFDYPSPIDVTGWIHGRASYPYLAKGPKITLANWLAFQRATGGNGFGFAMFLN